MQSQPEDTLGDRSGSTAGCDDDRDSPCAGCREVDEIDADAGASKDAQPWRPIEQGCIDDGVSPDDGPNGNGEVLRVRVGDEHHFVAEDVGDQRRIYRTEGHDDRTLRCHDVTRWVGGVTGSPPVPLLVVVITWLSCIRLVHPSRLLEAVNRALAPA